MISPSFSRGLDSLVSRVGMKRTRTGGREEPLEGSTGGTSRSPYSRYWRTSEGSGKWKPKPDPRPFSSCLLLKTVLYLNDHPFFLLLSPLYLSRVTHPLIHPRRLEHPPTTSTPPSPRIHNNTFRTQRRSIPTNLWLTLTVDSFQRSFVGVSKSGRKSF